MLFMTLYKLITPVLVYWASNYCYGTYGLVVTVRGRHKGIQMRCSHRSIIVAEKVLKIIPYITKCWAQRPKRGAIKLLYIFRLLMSAHTRSCPVVDISPWATISTDKQNHLYNLYRNRVNTRSKYLWYPILNNYNIISPPLLGSSRNLPKNAGYKY